MNPLRVGFAGYGVVGQLRHKYVNNVSSFTTVAVSDRKLENGNLLEHKVKTFSHYEELLNEDLDVLFVCLSNDVAADATIAGLNRGLHVFCEKPPGQNLNDIARVIECQKMHPKLKLKYGFNHRYHDSVVEAFQLVQAGNLGKVINMRGVYGKSAIINFASEWRTQRSISGGGILLDQGIHMVDLMRLFGGEFEEVFSFISNDYWNHDVEDNAYAMMRTRDGIVAMLHSSATQWQHRFSLEITLEKGAIVLSGLLTGTRSYGAETITIIHKSEQDSGMPMEISKRYTTDPSWEREIEEFSRAIIYKEKLRNGSSKEALRTMELVYKIYCADRKWKSIYNLSDEIPKFLD